MSCSTLIRMTLVTMHKSAMSDLRAARIAGWLLLILPVVLITLFVWSAWRSGAFEQTHAYRLLAAHVEGVKPGVPVEYAGLPIGIVNDVRLTDTGQAEVIVDIKERYLRWVRTDSVFSLEQPLLGGARIRIVSPDLRSPVLQAGAARRLQVNSVLEDILVQVKPILSDMQAISHSLADPSGSAKKTLAHMEKLSGRMAEQGIVAGLTANPATAKEVDRIAVEARAALQRINAAIEKTDVRLFGQSGLIDQSQAGLAQAVGALTALREGLVGLTRVVAQSERIATNLAAGTDNLTPLRDEVDRAIRRTDEILRQVENLLGGRASSVELP